MVKPSHITFSHFIAYIYYLNLCQMWSFLILYNHTIISTSALRRYFSVDMQALQVQHSLLHNIFGLNHIIKFTLPL